MKPYVFFLLLYSLFRHTQAEYPRNSIPIGPGYSVYRCDNDQESLMRDVHNSIKRFFPGLVTEIRKGVAGSKYGFEAFFLSNDNINPVVETFSRILDQEKVMIRGRPERILFVCVNADDQQPQIATFYQQWRTQVEQRQASGRSLEDAEKESTVALSITPDSNAILLYPTFFALPALPNRKRDCPVVKRTFSGGFSLPGVTQLQDSMYGTAIHELVHKYLHLSVQDVDEARTVADSMNLPAEKQVQNAANYAFLACAVKAKCIGLPKSDYRDGGLRT